MHEMVVTFHGQWVRLREGAEEAANPNVALFASPGDSYRVRHPDGQPDVCGVVQFRDHAIADLARMVDRPVTDRSSAFAHTTGVFAAPGHLTLHSLFARLSRGTGDPLEVEETISRLTVAALIDGRSDRPVPQDPAVARRHERAVRRAVEFLAERYRGPVTLPEVARAADYSPFHLCRVFRSRVGMTIHHYLARLRLREALHAILQGERDLSRLGHDLGFCSHSHLTHLFRREYGCTPSDVRAMSGGPERRAGRTVARSRTIPHDRPGW
ncbi:MAG: helix-turn-helix transcriptional regulator [Gemmatimonadales bacterium]